MLRIPVISPAEPRAADPLSQAKSAMRRRQRALRDAIVRHDRAAASLAAAGCAEAHLTGLPATIISAFWPIGSEIDTTPLLRSLAGRGKVAALPCMQGARLPLLFRVWRPGDRLEEAAFGVLQPTAEAEPVRPDVMLVPLLAYDRRGFRLGYGGGFYDRTLDAARQAGDTVGVVGYGFACQEVEAVPAGPQDQPLDGMITEQGYVALPATR